MDCTRVDEEFLAAFNIEAGWGGRRRREGSSSPSAGCKWVGLIESEILCCGT